MANEPSDLKPESWHRYFAIESNNLAWGLVSNPSRTPDETVRMVDAAHAASFHWGVVGNELNFMRAKTLLAEVQALAGSGRLALGLAEEIREYFLARPTEDWELAFVHTVHAHASYVAGESEKHHASYRTAEQAIDNISDEEDRRIVLGTFDQVPKPGGVDGA